MEVPCMNNIAPSALLSVPTIEALQAIAPAERAAGMVVWVEGYIKSGDPGGRWMVWEPDCGQPDNGGTVIAPSDNCQSGRWLLKHEGVGHYRWFGVFDESKPADDALDAMMADESIYRIEASSDLRFQRRHTFSRSRIELQFNGYTVYTSGMEEAPVNDPFAALLLFRGELAEEEQTWALTAPLEEMEERFPVADVSDFRVGDWWIVKCDRLAGGAERELEKLLQVTEVIDSRHVRFHYKNGWRLEPGREISYRRVNPVIGASVRNMKFYGAGATMTTGSHPLAYEFAVECHASGIDARGTFWPVIMRRYCSHYVTEGCKLTNPVEVLIGGTGYLTQQIYCLYGTVRDCLTSNGRHLNDYTGSAYCYVENCHAEGDDLGAYVTHGQYEHDLTYIGNSGLMSFANSGPTWGESAKRITVKKHVGSWFIAHRKVTDLTLEDVHVFKREGVENSSNTGAFWLNADGVQMRNCTAEAMVKFVQVSSRSKRPSVAENCSFTVAEDRRLSHEEVKEELNFVRCRFHGLSGNRFEGSGALSFRDCQLSGSGPDAKQIKLSSHSFSFMGGHISNVSVKLTGEGDRRIEIGAGAVLSGGSAGEAILKRECESGESGVTDWNLSGYTSRISEKSVAHFELGGGRNRYRASGVLFQGGKLACPENAFEHDGFMMHAGNVEQAVLRHEMPAESGRIKHTDNLIMSVSEAREGI